MRATGRKDVRVAVIDNSINPSIYTPVEHWAKFLGVPFSPYRAPDGRLPSPGSGYTHFILTGSEASIREREAWVDEEVEFVRDIVSRGFPVLGSCYGHQLLALALCGPDRVASSARPEVGWYPIDVLEENGLLGGKGRIYAFCSHFDEVAGLSEGFRILASTPDCPIQAFELIGRPVWGVQFHPEIDVPDARLFLGRLTELGLPSSPVFAAALRREARDSGVIRRIVGRFLSSTPVPDFLGKLG